MALGWRGQRMDRATLTTLLLSIGFGFLLLKSRRFVEYFPPFALIFAGMSCAPLIERALAAPVRWHRRLATIALAVGLVAPLAPTLARARETMSRSAPSATYAAASGWLRERTLAGSLIFQTDWGDFP